MCSLCSYGMMSRCACASCRVLREKEAVDEEFVALCRLRRGTAKYSLFHLLNLPVSVCMCDRTSGCMAGWMSLVVCMCIIIIVCASVVSVSACLYLCLSLSLPVSLSLSLSHTFTYTRTQLFIAFLYLLRCY